MPSPRERIGLDTAKLARILGRLRANANTWRAKRLHLLVATIARAGLSLDAEALPLRRVDHDARSSTLRIRRRTSLRGPFVEMSVSIPPDLNRDLDEWLSGDNPSGWIFPNLNLSGHWLSSTGTPGRRPRDLIREAGEAEGIPGLTPEALRLHHQAYGDEGGPAPRPRPILHAVGDSSPRGIEGLLTPDLVSRLMVWLKLGSATWEGHRLFALVAVVLRSDLAPCEALRLKLPEVDVSGRVLRPAGRRTLEIPEDLAEEVGEWLPRVESISEWLFPGTKLEGPWVGGRMGTRPRELIQAAALSAGVGRVTLQQLQQYRKALGGVVKLGDDYRATPSPKRPAGGPTPGKPGPPRGGGSGRDRFAWADRPISSRGLAVSGGPRASIKTGRSKSAVDLTLCVELSPPGKFALLWGRRVGPLTDSQFDVVSQLVRAGIDGLSKPDMDALCAYAGWRQTLLRLKNSHPSWNAAIQMAGHPYGKYRLAPRDR